MINHKRKRFCRANQKRKLESSSDETQEDIFKKTLNERHSGVRGNSDESNW